MACVLSVLFFLSLTISIDSVKNIKLLIDAFYNAMYTMYIFLNIYFIQDIALYWILLVYIFVYNIFNVYFLYSIYYLYIFPYNIFLFLIYFLANTSWFYRGVSWEIEGITSLGYYT